VASHRSLRAPQDSREKNTHHKQRAEDLLVVPGNPQRKVDIKVRASVVGVTRGNACKGASEPIRQQYQYFDRNKRDEEQR